MTLELRDVSFSRSGETVLQRISLKLTSGATGMITGATGAGKTSLLRLIAGLATPAGGSISFDGREWLSTAGPLPAEHRGVGMAFQDLVLWPHLRVVEQLEVTLRKWGRASRRARASQVLEALDLADVARRFPGEISGGQQQRVAIGRAVARKPGLLLLDEPTNQLDRVSAAKVSQWLRSEQKASGRILLLVTHDRDVGQMLGADALSSWELRDGTLRAAGEPI